MTRKFRECHRKSSISDRAITMIIDHSFLGSRRGAGRLASPYGPCEAKATPSTWGGLHTEQEDDWDTPVTPRMSGALPVTRRYGARDQQPATDTVECSPPRTSVKDIDSEDEEARGRLFEKKRVTSGWEAAAWSTAPHRRTLKRQDATLGGDGADDRGDWAGTWEQCGLSGNKTTAKGNAWSAPSHIRETSAGTEEDSGCERPNRPVNTAAGRGNWNQPAVPAPNPALDQHYSGDRKHFVDIWGANAQNIQAMNPVVPIYQKPMIPGVGIDQNPIVHPWGRTSVNYTSAQGGNPGVPDRKATSRANPDNYDGNRAAADGSRVFYSAILPTVPTLLDIANHAEYTAWFDMLKSVLKYHQLTPVVADDANRPHGPTAAKRWDQDRLRAAIIIKGALSFDVFERVRQNGWRDTEDPTGTIKKVRETHGAVCPCGNSQGMTLLDF